MNLTAVGCRTFLGLLSPGGQRARLVILTFHRVLEKADPLSPGEPDLAGFARQMQALSRLCNVLPLPEAVERLQRNALPERAACITFDDGYRNNLELAVPVLEQLRLPATIFVMQQAVEAGIMWNDLVIEGLRRAREGADLSSLGIGSLRWEHEVSRAAVVGKALEALKYLPVEERWERAREFFDRVAGVEPPRLMLTEKEVAQLADRGFDMGGHTVNHPILCTLDSDAAWQEIEGCSSWLQGIIGTRPASFAYPNGRKGRDYDNSHEEMVQRAGYRLAVSTDWACATAASDRFGLPRVSLSGSTDTAVGVRLARMLARSWVGAI